MSASPGFKPYRTIQTGPTSDAFREGWERLFGKKGPGPNPATDRGEGALTPLPTVNETAVPVRSAPVPDSLQPKDESPDAPKT